MIAIARPTTGQFKYTGDNQWTKGTDFLAAFGDANNNKIVTREEFRMKMDANNDGYVSATEFKNVLGGFQDTYNGGTGLANAFSNSNANLDNFKVSVDSLFSSMNVNTAGGSLNALTKEDFRGSDKLWGEGNRVWEGEFDPWLVQKDVNAVLARAEFSETQAPTPPPTPGPTRTNVLATTTQKNWFRAADILAVLDTDGDKKVSKNELKALADSNGRITASNVARVFNDNMNDTYNRYNQDGLSLSHSRFNASAYTDENRMFTNLDRNQDGAVDVKDFQSTYSDVWGPRGWTNRRDIQKMFGENLEFTPPVYR